MLSIDEAAQLLGVPSQKVQSLVDKGVLPLQKIDGELRIPQRAVLDYRMNSSARTQVPIGWQASTNKPPGGQAWGLDGRGIKLEDAQKRLLGKIDPRVREPSSLELDLSVLDGLRAPPPADPAATGPEA
jgi:excisionase family DNA binding protein